MALVVVLLLITVASSGLTFSAADIFDVTRFGARADGRTDDSQAFLKAWKAACNATRSATLLAPSRRTFFLKPLTFIGNCRLPIHVQIDGKLVAPSRRSAWKRCDGNTWIVFRYVNGLNIHGTGTLDAKGAAWWTKGLNKDVDNDLNYIPHLGACRKPTSFRIAGCKNIQMSGLRFLNSAGNHITIDYCKGLSIHNINIKAPKHSHNTDGINMIGTSNVIIRDSKIGTGDDCIAISNKCFNVNISGIHCGPGHGISIGSLGWGAAVAVEGIYVQKCSFTNTLASTRIKTWPGATGYARNIHYDHITLNRVHSAIEITQHYSGSREKSRAVQISGVHFTNVHGTGEQIILDCSQHVPCKHIHLRNVNIASPKSGRAVNVTCKYADIRASSVTPFIRRHCKR